MTHQYTADDFVIPEKTDSPEWCESDLGRVADNRRKRKGNSRGGNLVRRPLPSRLAAEQDAARKRLDDELLERMNTEKA